MILGKNLLGGMYMRVIKTWKKAVAYTLVTSFAIGSISIAKLGAYQVDAEDSWVDTGLIQNGDFEDSWDLSAWNQSDIYWSNDFKGSISVTDSGESSRYLNCGGDTDVIVTADLMQTVSLSKGDYRLTLDYCGDAKDSGLKIYAGDKEAAVWPSEGWSWKEAETYVDFSVSEDSDIALGLKGDIGNETWIKIDNIRLLNKETSNTDDKNKEGQDTNENTDTNEENGSVSGEAGNEGDAEIDKSGNEGDGEIDKPGNDNAGTNDKENIEGNKTVEEYDWKETTLLINGDFETKDLTGWSAEIDSSVDSGITVENNQWAANNISTYFNYWSNDKDVNLNISQVIKNLPAGRYKLVFQQEGANGCSGLAIECDGTKINLEATSGWDNWNEQEVIFTVSEKKDVLIKISGTIEENYWGKFDNFKLYSDGELSNVTEEKEEEEKEKEPDTAEDSEVMVKKNDKIAKNSEFITGFDLSSYASLKDSGVKYYDFDGNELNDQEFFNFLFSDCDVNYVRIKIWNDPYDANGNCYGGGNNDLATAVKIGKLASNAGMKVLIDFHYSDFWADPGKQMVPKQWAGYSVAEKEKAIYDYTKASLITLKNSGVNVGMVQVGNETNGYICGETNWDNIVRLFSAGSKAVREVCPDALVALHFANPETSGRYEGYAKKLADNNVDYDVFATSYYPYFHGTVSNLKNVLSNVASTYQKRVMVAETQYAYTLEEYDGNTNSRTEGDANTYYYSVSTQGQVDLISDVADCITSCGTLKDGTMAGIGLFYWEPAWLPVSVIEKDDPDYEKKVASNREKWQQYGSGWATSYAGEYQEDAKTWWGGDVIENEALFDAYGHPLVSLKAFHYLRTGAKAPLKVSSVEKVDEQIIELNQNYTLPTGLKVTYNDNTTRNVTVSWDDKTSVNTKKSGRYEVTGTFTVEEETENKEKVNSSYIVKTYITVEKENLLVNPKFEESPMGKGWTVERISGFNNEQDGAVKTDESNARSGKNVLHFWSDKDFSLDGYQTITLGKGVYSFGAKVQGEMKKDEEVDQVRAYYIINGERSDGDNVSLKGWRNWVDVKTSDFTVKEDNTEVRLGVIVKGTSGSWGNFDDFYLNKIGEYVEEKTAAPAEVKDTKKPEINDENVKKDGNADKDATDIDKEKKSSDVLVASVLTEGNTVNNTYEIIQKKAKTNFESKEKKTKDIITKDSKKDDTIVKADKTENVTESEEDRSETEETKNVSNTVETERIKGERKPVIPIALGGFAVFGLAIFGGIIFLTKKRK